MLDTVDPNLAVGELGIAALAVAALWYLVEWVRTAPTHADPWDAETEKQIQDAPEICPHCSTPQPPTAWFCEHCGRAVGPYNNLMPYVQVFSEGEVFRNGASGRFRHRPLVLIGFILIALSTYLVLAPVYLFFLFRLWRQPAGGHEIGNEPGVH